MCEENEIEYDDAAEYHDRDYAYDNQSYYNKIIAESTSIAYFNKGKVYLSDAHFDGDFDKAFGKAIEYFTEAIRLNPDRDYAYSYYNKIIAESRSIAYFNKGKECMSHLDFDKAIEYFTEAIRLNPDDAEIYDARGFSYWMNLEYDKTIADYTEWIRLKPDDADAYLNRAVVYEDMGEYYKAAADCEAVFRIDPDELSRRSLEYIRAEMTSFYFTSGGVFMSGELDGMTAELTETIRENPNNAASYLRRGMCYEWSGKGDEAIADYTEAIRLKPEHHNAYLRRGYAYFHAGGYDSAIADYTEAIRLESGFAVAYMYRGWAYFRNGACDKAIADFNESIRIEPTGGMTPPLAYFGRGNAYRKTGEYEKALADYETLLQIEHDQCFLVPTHPILRKLCAEVRAEMRKSETQNILNA